MKYGRVSTNVISVIPSEMKRVSGKNCCRPNVAPDFVIETKKGRPKFLEILILLISRAWSSILMSGCKVGTKPSQGETRGMAGGGTNPPPPRLVYESLKPVTQSRTCCWPRAQRIKCMKARFKWYSKGTPPRHRLCVYTKHQSKSFHWQSNKAPYNTIRHNIA